MLRSAERRMSELTDESSDVAAALMEGISSARRDIGAAVELAQERIGARGP